jgi:predicted RNA-binding protein YlqC (UPF0109 family)
MENMTDVLKDVVEFIIKRLVDNPEEAKVEVTTSTKSILVQIKTSKSDTGKVIGKKGRTIDAVKIVTSCIKNTQFSGDSRRVMLEVLEDENQSFNKKNKLS